ncbi:MAG TPA: hypothetical protein VII99_09115, partial [Bacteroidia bacterium]
YDIVNAKNILISEGSLKTIENILLSSEVADNETKTEKVKKVKTKTETKAKSSTKATAKKKSTKK